MKFTLRLLNTAVFFFISCYFAFGQSQAQLIISNQTITDQSISARDEIIVHPNSNIKATAGHESRLFIDKTIQVPVSYQSSGVNYSNTIPPINFNLPVGATAGSGSVATSGQATYSIPIIVPPGTKGIAPVLGIFYNSASADGILGRGWNINGLSVITRSPGDIYHDCSKKGIMLNNADGFALDGTRMIASTDGTLHLENDDFSKITPPTAANPFFLLETKNGMTMEYGSNNNITHSQLIVKDQNNLNVTLAWHLSKAYVIANAYICTVDNLLRTLNLTEMKNNGQTKGPTITVKQAEGDRKENKKSPRFAFSKISFADTHLAHLPLPPTTRAKYRGKVKRFYVKINAILKLFLLLFLQNPRTTIS